MSKLKEIKEEMIRDIEDMYFDGKTLDDKSAKELSKMTEIQIMTVQKLLAELIKHRNE